MPGLLLTETSGFINAFSLFPLTNIFETNHYPHARTLRSSFFRKLLDTILVITGNYTECEPKDKLHLGVFDYLTFFLPSILLFLWFNSCGVCGGCKYFEEDSFLAGILNVSICLINVPIFLLLPVINIPLIIIRYSVGVVATILLSPIVFMVHSISCCIARKEYDNIYHLEGSSVNEQPQSFGDYLKNNDLSIDDLTIKVEKNQGSFNLRVKCTVGDSGCKCSCCNPPIVQFLDFLTTPTKKHNSDNPSFSSKLNKKNAPYIKSFFTLNMNNVAGQIEDDTNKELSLEDKKTIFSF